ncbi:hypothetical protein CIW62_00430 [Enterobacter cloacae]|uniref:hypothetical protein n=1 Tax=Enterobacter cloacae TaxID=550 RepID=UPI000BA88C91|nr:hypothetical protein [Enterobacter cloacae]PAN71815.1 hypothetical protein CIW70_11485 [Enterobacter cloacae]PAO04256.1 hypothetical protein CIW62_00430 [Enterobacter cloacae]HAS0902474.1 hypothetical protein [Enterobacter cloacae]HAS1049877.1 hypothetical protein [Enterobacter cloacae]HAS1063849.1 hypothetical protein [Enterobacter cloacae]
MASGRKPKYDSLNLHVPDDLKQAFIDGFGEVGLHAGTVQCFSSKPTSIKEYLSVIFERGRAYAPLVLKALDMLQRKHSIKIEVTAERKIVELRGISTEDALKLIVAADSIRVSHANNTEVSDTDSPLNNPAN